MGAFRAQSSLVSSPKGGQRIRGKGFLEICSLVDAVLIRAFGDKAKGYRQFLFKCWGIAP